jgi:hypothetical protein
MLRGMRMLFADKLNNRRETPELAHVFKAPFEDRNLPPERINRLLLFKFAPPEIKAAPQQLDEPAA